MGAPPPTAVPAPNLFKALPNIAIYLSLYDVLLIRLQRLGL